MGLNFVLCDFGFVSCPLLRETVGKFSEFVHTQVSLNRECVIYFILLLFFFVVCLHTVIQL
jgi:hypothetical protein